MEQIIKGDELSQSENIVETNIEKLKALFPEIVTEDKIDFKVLQEVLGNELEEGEEYYRFTWAGKANARREAQKPSTGTLRPAPEESVDWNTTKNLYIEGDNLEVLKLLQKSYAGKVKMIFTDPPYNTGKDFVYKDNYKDNLRNYQEVTGQLDKEGNRLSTNSDSDGRYHSNWLNMMYPRLRLARNLLSEDGVIFICIDDNEAHNLKKLCDEIFGEDNFVADLIWEKRYGRSNDAKLMASAFDHIIMYKKSEKLIKLREARTESADKGYSNPDKDERGVWTSVSFVSQRTKAERPNLKYKIINPNTNIEFEHPTNAWKYAEDKYLQMLSENRFHWGKDGTQQFPRIKRFLSELDEGMVPINLWKHKESGTGDEGTKEVNALIGKDVFSYPKPTRLIERAISLGLNLSNGEDIIMDFFSGSAATAHAVMNLNCNDNGKRKFVQVQLPELTEEKSQAYKTGFKKITEIGKERIRRAAKKIAVEHPEKAKDLDLGFKVFKLDTSNLKGWDGNPGSLDDSLFDAQDNIKTDRTEHDVLYEILLKYGLDLTLPIKEKQIAGKTVFSVGYGALFICLADSINSKVALGIGEWKEELQPEVCRVVFKDSGFTDVEKTNSVQTLKRYGITEIKSI